MTDHENNNTPKPPRIVVRPNGPYRVEGNIPLGRKAQVVSEHAEPITWRPEGENQPDAGDYYLCRCGRSANKPFCDGTHKTFPFDGNETADPGLREERTFTYSGGSGIIVDKDPSICTNAGFCGLKGADTASLVKGTGDTKIRSLLMAMVERCPSGSLTYRIQEDEANIEPDLPVKISTTTEVVSGKVIAGPLWVTGGIPVERSDGQPFEARNRVTLCNCGRSGNKPLCDGKHRHLAEEDARQQGADSGQ